MKGKAIKCKACNGTGKELSVLLDELSCMECNGMGEIYEDDYYDKSSR